MGQMTSDRGRLRTHHMYGRIMGTCICMKETAYVINVILLLHVVHAFGVYMSWCMGCMWDICHIVAPWQ